MGGSEQEALRASDDVFSSSQGVWQKLEGQGKVGSPLLSCQARPTSKGQPTSNCRACQQSKQVLATGEPDSLPPTWHVVQGKEMHTHLESPLALWKSPGFSPSPAASQRHIAHLFCAPTPVPIATGRPEESSEGPGATRQVPRKARLCPLTIWQHS